MLKIMAWHKNIRPVWHDAFSSSSHWLKRNASLIWTAHRMAFVGLRGVKLFLLIRPDCGLVERRGGQVKDGRLQSFTLSRRQVIIQRVTGKWGNVTCCLSKWKVREWSANTIATKRVCDLWGECAEYTQQIKVIFSNCRICKLLDWVPLKPKPETVKFKVQLWKRNFGLIIYFTINNWSRPQEPKLNTHSTSVHAHIAYNIYWYVRPWLDGYTLDISMQAHLHPVWNGNQDFSHFAAKSRFTSENEVHGKT